MAVDEVLGDAKVEGLKIRDTTTGEVSEMRLDGVFIAIGYVPNTGPFRDWLEVDAKGYLVVHDDPLRCRGRVHRRRRPRPPLSPAVTAAGDGCKAAIDAERWLEAQGITEAATATAW